MSHQPQYIVAIRSKNAIYGVFLWIKSTILLSYGNIARYYNSK